MSRFNLSSWALANRGLVVYFMILSALVGAWSYTHLGQSEDPPFTFRVMVIRTLWPGATADEVARQVTDRIEEKLQESVYLDYLRSYSKPGESQVFFVARQDWPSRVMPDAFYEVRKKVGDIQHNLPQGVIGPFFNDEYGTTYGNIYALRGEDFSDAELHDYADQVRAQLLRVAEVAKVDFFGVQDEQIEIRVDNIKRASLGIPMSALSDALTSRNTMTASGAIDTATDKIYLRTTGLLSSLEDVRDTPVVWQGRTLRIGDVAEVVRVYPDPAQPKVRFNGDRAVTIGISMEEDGDILRLGRALDAEVKRIREQLPLGMRLDRVADQPRAVQDSVGEFVRALAEAVAIVLAVSFFSLGLRPGLVVAATIPLVLAMTFACMKFFGIGLHKISLGALVLALGLLVDDAIIAVEMMAIKMEQGMDRLRAAAFAYTSTAFPMLSGTLVTAAGFLPIAVAASSTGEYTRSLFQVVTIALLLSWIAAVVFVPWLGFRLLPDHPAASADGTGPAHDPYDTRFYRSFRRLVAWAVAYRWLVIGVTLAAFAASIALFRFVPQQFFPDSTRSELLVHITLEQGASVQATDAVARRLDELLGDASGIDNFVAYIGTGSPRFYLPLDQQLPTENFAEFVITATDLHAREALRSMLLQRLPELIPDARWRVIRLENGPPVGYPVQFRVSGPSVAQTQTLAHELADRLRREPRLSNVNLDWQEPSKIVRLLVDQDRAQALGLTSQNVAQTLQATLSGARITSYLERNRQIGVLFRGPPADRDAIATLDSLSVTADNGAVVPLAQIARLDYTMEPGIVWRRDRLPTVTVRADIYGGEQAATITAQLRPALDELRARMPLGYRIDIGGAVEESNRGQASVNAGMPLLIVAVLTVLMIQLRSFSRTLLVVLTAPLGLIGVTASMLLLQESFGFVAMLGTIALSGMIMRNSLILVDQIETDRAAGRQPVDAIIDSTVRRLRPIVLTAAAAVLAMIPLTRSVFFGPMAVAIMGGLIAATALTLIFLPSLYAAWFRVPRR